jgi:plastocyanin
MSTRPSRSRRLRRPLAGAAVCAALALAGAACGSDSSTSASTTTAAPAPAEATNAVTVSTPGMTYETSGSLRPGVATITLENTDDQSHMMAFAPLADGVTLDQFRAALDQGEEAAGQLLATPPDQAIYGTPAPVAGGESTTVTAKDLPAGEYVLICFFTTDDGTPHWKMGMIGSLTVAGDPSTGTPDSDGTITIDDQGITLPDGFDGHGTFLVTNDGTSPHSISFARLDAGTTLDAYYQHIGQAMATNSSIDGGGGALVGGVDELLPGQSAFLTVDLDAGHYGYVSTTDANGPEIPVQHGELDVS